MLEPGLVSRDLIEERMSDHLKEQKSLLRRQGRARRNDLSPVEHERASRAVCHRVLELPVVQEVSAIALFWPMGSEVEIKELWRALGRKHKRIYAPFMRKNQQSEPELGFSHVKHERELSAKKHGFSQPPAELSSAAPGEIDLMVIPALLMTLEGHRLGYGAGFYDRMLLRFKPQVKSLFIGFECQLISELPLEPHDQSADYIVTESRALSLPA